MRTNESNIIRYMNAEPRKQFDFIYENYAVIDELLADYKEDLITDIIEQKIYNSKSGDEALGVRIQISNGLNNPTQNVGIEYLNVERAITEGNLDEEFFRGTDDRDELIERVSGLLILTEDVRLFNRKFNSLNPKDQNILGQYIRKEKTLCQLATDMQIEYDSAVKHVYRIKKRLIDKVEPRLCMKKGA